MSLPNGTASLPVADFGSDPHVHHNLQECVVYHHISTKITFIEHTSLIFNHIFKYSYARSPILQPQEPNYVISGLQDLASCMENEMGTGLTVLYIIQIINVLCITML